MTATTPTAPTATATTATPAEDDRARADQSVGDDNGLDRTGSDHAAADATVVDGTDRPGPFRRLYAAVDRHPVVVLLLAVVVAAVAYTVNLTRAPDFNIDETFYALAGQHIGVQDSVSFGELPIRVHPPLFFIAVAGWLAALGDLHAPVLSAIHSARFLNAVLDVAVVALTFVLGRNWLAARAGATRGRVLLGLVVLVTFNAFMLRFGRLLLIEPMAVAVSLLTLLVAWRLRERAASVFVPVVGALIGLSLLVKEPTLFVVGAPVLAAALRRDVRALGRNLAALGVGVVVFGAFPIWEALNGDWGPFFFTQTFSVRRLLGLVQVSGLNRAGVDPLAAFRDTFWQYSGAYVTFAVGGVALVVAATRWFTQGRGRGLDDGIAHVLGLGLLSYGFLGYSVTVGQSNEQLTVYSVPAAALLALAHPLLPRRPRGGAGVAATGRPSRRIGAQAVVSLLLVIAAALGVGGWTQLFAFGCDDATAQVEAFIQRHYADCVPVNATGDPFHWSATLRTHPVTSFGNGPAAVAVGVQVFLLSPKDAQFHYGNSSPALTAWVHRYGQEVYRVPSHTSREISVWQVGTPSVPRGATLANCTQPVPAPDPAHLAPASRFGLVLAGLLAADAVLALGWAALRRRRPGAHAA